MVPEHYKVARSRKATIFIKILALKGLIQEIKNVRTRITLIFRESIHQLSIELLSAFMDAHESCLDEVKNGKAFQNIIFQIIFDIKFLTNLLCGNAEMNDQVCDKKE